MNKTTIDRIKKMFITPQDRIDRIEDIKTLIQIGLSQLEGNPEYSNPDNPKLCNAGYKQLEVLDKKISFWERVENYQDMKEYFEEQLKTIKPVTKDILKKLKGKSFYSDYQEGDRIVSFLNQTYGDIEPPYTVPSIKLGVTMVAEREISKLEQDFNFIRMATNFPVLESKEIIR